MNSQAIRIPEVPTHSTAQVFPIQEWCRQACISRSYLYRLWNEGRGPQRVDVGRGKVLITESPIQWLTRLQGVAAGGSV